MVCRKIGIPLGTLLEYITPDKTKGRKINNGVGKPSLMNDFNYDFAGQVAARKDEANDGMAQRDMIDLVQELAPCISQKSASRQVSRHIIPKSIKNNYIKGFVTPQSTTTDRSTTTVQQQFRWHILVNEQFKQLRLKNTGLCNLSNITFGEVMAHFVWGLDEESICADHNGNVKIIGSAGKGKHEKFSKIVESQSH